MNWNRPVAVEVPALAVGLRLDSRCAVASRYRSRRRSSGPRRGSPRSPRRSPPCPSPARGRDGGSGLARADGSMVNRNMTQPQERRSAPRRLTFRPYGKESLNDPRTCPSRFGRAVWPCAARATTRGARRRLGLRGGCAGDRGPVPPDLRDRIGAAMLIHASMGRMRRCPRPRGRDPARPGPLRPRRGGARRPPRGARGRAWLA